VNSKGLGIISVLAFGLTSLAHAQQAAPAAAAPDTAALQTGPATVAPHWSKYDYPTSIPEGASYYIIVRGDTLWDISARYMGTPFLWPQIWDANRYIKDAHWIYPGDPLILPKVQVVTDGAGMAEAPIVDEGAAFSEETNRLVPAVEELRLQCGDLVVDEPEDESFYILGSEQGASKNAYAERDILYLSKGSAAGVKPGDVYTMAHRTYDVKHPDTHVTLGTKVETTGWLRVLLVTENSATAIIEQSCRDAHDGDYLKPFSRVSVPLIADRRSVPTRMDPPTGATNGTIVDIHEDAFIAAEGHLLTINLGTEQGVAPGNMFTVYRIMYPSVPTSRNVIGELVVVAARARTSLARVSYSNDALMPGDRLERR
jgi:hypothetical protein